MEGGGRVVKGDQPNDIDPLCSAPPAERAMMTPPRSSLSHPSLLFCLTVASTRHRLSSSPSLSAACTSSVVEHSETHLNKSCKVKRCGKR